MLEHLLIVVSLTSGILYICSVIHMAYKKVKDACSNKRPK